MREVKVSEHALNVHTFGREILIMAGIDDPNYREFVFDEEGLRDLLEQARSGADIIYD